MIKLLVILLLLIPVSASSQVINVDSLGNIIKAMQKQISDFQKKDTLTFTNTQMTVVRTNPANQTVLINNYAAMNNSATVAAKASTDVASLTAQLATANAKITALETKVTALQAKVAALKAVSTTTTIIQ